MVPAHQLLCSRSSMKPDLILPYPCTEAPACCSINITRSTVGDTQGNCGNGPAHSSEQLTFAFPCGPASQSCAWDIAELPHHAGSARRGNELFTAYCPAYQQCSHDYMHMHNPWQSELCCSKDFAQSLSTFQVQMCSGMACSGWCCLLLLPMHPSLLAGRTDSKLCCLSSSVA